MDETTLFSHFRNPQVHANRQVDIIPQAGLLVKGKYLILPDVVLARTGEEFCQLACAFRVGNS